MTPPSEIPSPSPAPHAATTEAPSHSARFLVQAMIALMVVTVALRSCVVESCPVLGPSMEPTLNDGERVLVWKLPTVLSRIPLIGGTLDIEPGSLVVFERPEENGRRYVKRVIASGSRDEGEGLVRVVFEQGRVFVDNRLLAEDYLVPEERESPLDYDATLEPGQFFVLGDHRSVSKDSLRFGPIQEDQIIGKAVLRVWPLGKFSAL